MAVRRARRVGPGRAGQRQRAEGAAWKTAHPAGHGGVAVEAHHVLPVVGGEVERGAGGPCVGPLDRVPRGHDAERVAAVDGDGALAVVADLLVVGGVARRLALVRGVGVRVPAADQRDPGSARKVRAGCVCRCRKGVCGDKPPCRAAPAAGAGASGVRLQRARVGAQDGPGGAGGLADVRAEDVGAAGRVVGEGVALRSGGTGSAAAVGVRATGGASRAALLGRLVLRRPPPRASLSSPRRRGSGCRACRGPT